MLACYFVTMYTWAGVTRLDPVTLLLAVAGVAGAAPAAEGSALLVLRVLLRVRLLLGSVCMHMILQTPFRAEFHENTHISRLSEAMAHEQAKSWEYCLPDPQVEVAPCSAEEHEKLSWPSPARLLLLCEM